MNLRDCPLGCELRIDCAALGSEAVLRLGELGLRSGTVVSVLQRAGFGGRVVLCGRQRFAIDAATAAALTGTRVGAAPAPVPSAQAA